MKFDIYFAIFLLTKTARITLADINFQQIDRSAYDYDYDFDYDYDYGYDYDYDYDCDYDITVTMTMTSL